MPVSTQVRYLLTQVFLSLLSLLGGQTLNILTLNETHNYLLPSELSVDYSSKIFPILVSLSMYIAVYDRRDQCLFDKFSLIASGSN